MEEVCFERSVLVFVLPQQVEHHHFSGTHHLEGLVHARGGFVATHLGIVSHKLEGFHHAVAHAAA